jgi:hypothetical protein
MKRAILAVSTALLGLAFAAPGFAGAIGDGNPVFALHVKARAAKPTTICTTENPQTTDCTTYSTSGELNTAYDLYLVVAGIDSTNIGDVAGASCGIQYDNADGSGVDVFQWTFCADGLEFKNGPDGGADWPASGGGNRMTWTTCQNMISPGYTGSSIQVTFGAFYVFAYSPDRFTITPNNNLGSGPELTMGACDASQVFLENQWSAYADFGGGAGCNTCLQPCPKDVPVQPTTWGSVKSLYKN